MSKKNELQKFISAKELKYENPNSDYIDNKKVVQAIQNAWKNSCVLCNDGNIWVYTKNLHTILRTTKDIAKYYVQQVSKNNKQKIDDDTIVKGCEIIYILDERLQNAGEIQKEKYLKYSNDTYSSIRDCDKAKLIRAEYYEMMKTYKNKLKKERIKKFTITKDELTNENLNKKNSEFSHIRSFSIYKDLATNIYNGLIVNKDTHKIITENKINDEDELYDLCEKQKWNIDWYEKYKEMIDNL